MVDLEAIREHVNELPPHKLEPLAIAAWDVAKSARGGVRGNEIAQNLYIIACIASRIADERLWEGPAAVFAND